MQISVLRIGIAGAGRMGTAVAQAIEAAGDLDLAGIWQRGEDLGAIAAAADVIIDFSLPGATDTVVAAARQSGIPLVCGVTGLGEAQLAAIESLSRSVPVVYDRNMSPGITVLEWIAAAAAAALGDDFSVRIHETHHVHKLDAPSGTALKLGEAVARARGQDPQEIHYESERRGEVPGDHEVILASSTERLVLEHSVTTRDVFANGAVRAARWVSDQAPGLYSMRHVLGWDQ